MLTHGTTAGKSTCVGGDWEILRQHLREEWALGGPSLEGLDLLCRNRSSRNTRAKLAGYQEDVVGQKRAPFAVQCVGACFGSFLNFNNGTCSSVKFVLSQSWSDMEY